MQKIEIELTDSNFDYLKNDPYIKDESGFINLLIKRWITEKKQAVQEAEKAMNDPKVLSDGT